MDDRLKKHPLGFWEVIDKPTGEELERYYADKYYQEGLGSYEQEYSEEELLFFRAKIEQRWAVIDRNLTHKKGRLLDVGCGEGYSLAFFREKGWEVKGLDFSSAGVASKNPGVMDALVTGDLFELLAGEIAEGRRYDVIWLQNVLEHVVDPVDLLKVLKTLVSPEGIAVITVPNDFSVIQKEALAQGHIEERFWVALPEHLSYFDFESLSNTASATGWDCVEMLGDFPVDWYLFCQPSNYMRDKTLGKAAHRARVQLENLIHTRPVGDAIQFWSALAKLGLGRNLTAFLRPGAGE